MIGLNFARRPSQTRTWCIINPSRWMPLLIALLAGLGPAQSQELSRGEVRAAYENAILFLQIEQKNTTGVMTPVSTGTGFIVSEDGYVITNTHVVTAGGNISSPDRIIGSPRSRYASKEELRVINLDSARDIALLQFKDVGPQRSAVIIGDSNDVEDDATVYAFGFPFDEDLLGSTGTITGKTGDFGRWRTDLALNPGNSGGPIFNISGKVIGIAVSRNPSATLITHMIPINFSLDALQGHGVKFDLAQPLHLGDPPTMMVNIKTPTSPDSSDPSGQKQKRLRLYLEQHLGERLQSGFTAEVKVSPEERPSDTTSSLAMRPDEVDRTVTDAFSDAALTNTGAFPEYYLDVLIKSVANETFFVWSAKRVSFDPLDSGNERRESGVIQYLLEKDIFTTDGLVERSAMDDKIFLMTDELRSFWPEIAVKRGLMTLCFLPSNPADTDEKLISSKLPRLLALRLSKSPIMWEDYEVTYVNEHDIDEFCDSQMNYSKLRNKYVSDSTIDYFIEGNVETAAPFHNYELVISKPVRRGNTRRQALREFLAEVRYESGRWHDVHRPLAEFIACIWDAAVDFMEWQPPANLEDLEANCQEKNFGRS